MVAVRNFKCFFQIWDGCKQRVGCGCVLRDDSFFYFCQRAFFSKDFIRDSHFANIVQERASVDVNQGFICKLKSAGQHECHFGHSAAMAFSFLIT